MLGRVLLTMFQRVVRALRIRLFNEMGVKIDRYDSALLIGSLLEIFGGLRKPIMCKFVGRIARRDQVVRGGREACKTTSERIGLP